MFTRAFLLSLAALALADPIPQAASPAPTSFDTSAPTSIPSYNDPSLSAALSSESSLDSLLSGIPTLASTYENALLSAIPTTLAVTDVGCAAIATAEPDWYKTLPADVKSALTSYEFAVASWYSVHSSQLAALTSGNTVAVPTYTGCGATAGGTGTAGGLTVTSTSAGGKTTATSAGSGTKTSAGGSAAGGSGSSGTAAGTAASATKAAGAAPKATGAVAVGIAGLVGVLGVMVAL